jgi:hypothetical protein
MKSTLILLAAAVTMTVCNLQADDLNPSAPGPSDPDLAKKLIVEFTNNRWTAEKVLIATGTLTNNNAVPVTVTRIIATGFDKQQNVVAGGSGFPQESSYTIGNDEIAAGATVNFKVALSDAKKVIRFVRAIPYAEPIPTPELMPTPIQTSAPTSPPKPISDSVKIAGAQDSDATPAAVLIPNADIVDNALAYSKLLIPFFKTHKIPGRIQEERVLWLFRTLYHAAESEGYADRQDWFIELVMRQLNAAGVVDDYANQ